MKSSEAREQSALFGWLEWYGNICPEGKLAYHIPNGGSRNVIEARNLKLQGVKAGVPDICLPVPRGGYHGMYIEMKYGKNTTTDAQNLWLEALREQGYYTAVCYSCEAAQAEIKRYLEERK